MRFAILPHDRGTLPGHVRVSGLVSGAGSGDCAIWADLPESLAEHVPDRLDAWLLWLLPHAFHTQQELVLDGPVDPMLLRNAHELMEIWSRWQSDRRPIRVRAEPADLPAPGGRMPERVGLFFTGGVDSFFTLYHHDTQAAAHPEWRQRAVDDLIYVSGFDIPLANADACARKVRTLGRVASESGKELITLATNLRDTGVRQPWGAVMHGPALGGIGLLLGNRWREVLLSSWFCHEDNVAWGSTAITDPLLSTSRTCTRPYGAGYDRYEKTSFLARHRLVLETLHVCWKEQSEVNCGRCEKCYRTLLALDVLGIRDRATTFPPGPLDLGRLAEVWIEAPLYVRMYEQLRDHAARTGRDDVAAAIEACLTRS